jgi:hypothetical protein
LKEGNENNYRLCYENLCKEFVKYDPEEVARRSGAHYDSEKKQFALTYFNKKYLISYPKGTIVLEEDKKRIYLRMKIEGC